MCTRALRRQIAKLALLATASLSIGFSPTLANPEGGQVVAGSATVAGEGTGNLTVYQTTPNAIINWNSFSIGAGEQTTFVQPTAQSVTLNRVVGTDPSQILGSLSANGIVILVNRNGILFGSTSTVDAAGLVASTHDIGNQAFMAGGTLRFDQSGEPGASVVNEGRISVRNAGLAAFVAPHVRNDGVIVANMGRVALGAGNAFTLDLYGDNLVSFALSDEITKTLAGTNGAPLKALVENNGRITANGGRVALTAQAARDVVNQSVNVGGVVEANTVANVNGAIVLSGGGSVTVEKDAIVTASGTTGGSISISGDQAHVNGTVRADGSDGEASVHLDDTRRGRRDSAGQETLNERVGEDRDTASASAGGQGGTIAVTGTRFVSMGGTASADGATGGTITVNAPEGNFSLGGTISAKGLQGKGGSVAIDVARESWEFGGTGIDVSGQTDGGSIRHVAGSKLVTSATYVAAGQTGLGGKIDLSADAVFLFSAQFGASGGNGGGTVRLGGEFQGGKALAVDELRNARTLVANDSVRVVVASSGQSGNGGTAILWSNDKTTFLGSVDARGGLVSGTGGLVEISSAEDMIYRGTVETARSGQRGGTLLLDPKNITIADGSFNQQALILGAFYNGSSSALPGATIDPGDFFGGALALDGTRLAVGAHGDGGATNSCSFCGAVYLFTFADLEFNGGALAGRIGNGYTGGKNLDTSGMVSGTDQFGLAVALEGTRLAIGAYEDDGAGNACTNCGTVYLYNFADTVFTGGSLAARIGHGYTGGNNVNLAGTLDGADRFGIAVSLDGNRLAVGAAADDGAGNACGDCGAVYLFNFTDTSFSGGSIAGRVGHGYTGGNNVNIAGNIASGAWFGSAVSLDGTRLAVGAYLDNGTGCGQCGAAYLFTFSNAAFAGGSLAAKLGQGYSGGNNINMAPFIDSNDGFGISVSLDGNRLAVGALGDGGSSNSCGQCGAAYLFTFADSAFSGGALAARLGSGYTGGNNFNLAFSLNGLDQFGYAVALDGNRLAVGAYRDDGISNTCGDCGVVYLFNFADANFSGATLTARLGADYPFPGALSTLNDLGTSDLFGSAVSLDGTRLAVGVPGDDGATNSCANCGTAYLFTFSDLSFSGGALVARVGDGYTGGKNINLAGILESNDTLGYSVSLNGTRLAVGARLDDGATNGCFDCGAVYLFNFADAAFTGGSLNARIGDGYNGGNNINLAGILGSADEFGWSASLDGTRLAVGAYRDDGATNNCLNCGAVYLFNFANTSFAGGSLNARIGDGYTGGNNVNLTGILDSDDEFGWAVALDGTRLAVGAYLDDGSGNACGNCGAVYLFNFASSSLSGGVLTARIGNGYIGGDNVNLTGVISASDQFGSSVSLDGTRLAIGAIGDDGASNGCSDCGAAYIFSFAGMSLNGGTLDGRIGDGYSGGNNFNLSGSLGSNDWFGWAVSLDGTRLAISARLDDGATNTCSDCGAVYLFRQSASGLPGTLYANNPADSITITPTALKTLLDAGTASWRSPPCRSSMNMRPGSASLIRRSSRLTTSWRRRSRRHDQRSQRAHAGSSSRTPS